MNKTLKTSILFILLFCCISFSFPVESVSDSVIDKIKIVPADVPQGFRYGLIPNFAKKVLLDNPWKMDKTAIAKLAKNIYPNGDPSVIKNMHVSIIAKNEKPYNDDIVCYIIEYKDISSGNKEILKLTEFSRFNADRTIVFQKGTVAVFFIVDDSSNYKYIQALKEVIEKRFGD